MKSIKQEKQWQQQLVSQNLRSSLSLAVSRIEANIEDQARAFLSSLPSQQSPFLSDLFQSLNTLLERQRFIEQAVLNLLDNAVKYSGENKYVEVSAGIQGQNDLIKVTDHGSGISKGDLQKIFEKFYRVESREGKNVPGSGIGLTLVKEIVEAHGGRVEVESEVGKGSTFTLALPLAQV